MRLSISKKIKTTQAIGIIAVLLLQTSYPYLGTEAKTVTIPANLILEESPTGRLFSNPNPKPNKTVFTTITAYTSSPDETDDSPTKSASGLKVYDGMVAANWLPFGTVIKIPALYGDKIFTVHDRMNSRFGYGRIDIWLPTNTAVARHFGVKRTTIEIYLPNKKFARQ
jgi:3D (Asp-Asp-Asp) domain-containing protein